MLGVTVPDIHRSLDKAVQATMIPAARVRGIYIDAARLEQYEQALMTAAIGGDEKAIAPAVRVQERKATLSRFDTLPSRPSSHGFSNTTVPSSARPGCSPKVRSTRERAALSARITLVWNDRWFRSSEVQILPPQPAKGQR